MAEERKLCVVTGATSGIGAAFAERFARMGYALLLVGRRREILGARAGEIGRRHGVPAEAMVCDLSVPEDLARLEAVVSAAPRLEILVNNAGFGLARPFLSEEPDASSRMVDVHCRAALRLSRAALPVMLRTGRGTIINVASLAAFAPLPHDPAYPASKAFLVSLSESLHAAYGRKGIRIQALCPGLTRTDFHGRLGIGEERLRNRGPVRWMSAERVVDASLSCLDRGRVICIPGFGNALVRAALRLIPRTLLYRALGFARL
jgi:short-subunit dehydrogenase